MEFQSLRNGLIAKTPRVTSCPGAAGVGSVFGMERVYRWGLMGLEVAFLDHKVLNYPFTNSLQTSRKGALTTES